MAAWLMQPDIVQRLASIEGHLSDEEGGALLLAALHGPGQGAVVEIGSFMGRSTCFLALGCKMAGRGKVIAIDHFLGSPQQQRGGAYEAAEVVLRGTTYPKFCENIGQAGLTDYVHATRKCSEDSACGWTTKIRLLFIDGDHAYESVKRDFTLYAPHVEPEGLICFHDVNWPDVARFHQELISCGWRHEFRVHSLAAISHPA
ncbi:MAG TPA: class I SAM-dependent methyltransferase [Alphaproteobacteria bacterium]